MARSLAFHWTLASLVMTAAACTTGVDDNGFTGSFTGPVNTSGPMGVTTFDDTESTSSVATDDQGSGGGSADETTGMSSGPDPDSGTTMGVATTDPGTGSTSGPAGCNPPCGLNETCVDGICEPPACNDVAGNYDVCLDAGGAVDTSGCGDPSATCITVGTPPIASACSVIQCSDVCDCPFAPATGNAALTCGPLTGGDNLCYLDCSGGQTCPNGMVCFAEQACIWPGEGADGTPYGDCHNNDISTACGLEGICLADDADTVGVCTENCVGVGSCPAAPPGGSSPVTCQDVTADGANECVIDCTFGSCPTGMTCFGGFLCAWS